MVIKVQYDISNVYISTTESPVYINVRYDQATDPLKVPYVGATDDVDLGEFGLSAGYLQVDTTPTNTPGTQGTMYWDDNAETVALVMNGTVQKVGEDVFYHVVNQSGSSIPKGTAVRFAGTDGNSGKLLIAPFLANGTYPSFYYMGITAETIANGSAGKVYEFGKMRNINTSIYNDGDILYASSTVAGGFQTNAPSAPNNIIVVAAVVNAANNGTLMIRSTITDAGGNIYNTDGTLTGNRTVTMGSNTLSFEKDVFVSGIRVGTKSLASDKNTVMGFNGLSVLTTGGQNSVFGYEAGKALTSGFDNTFIGHKSGLSATTPDNNTFVGTQSGMNITTGSYNTFVGRSAGFTTTASLRNVFIGEAAGIFHNTGNENVFVGYESGRNSSTSAGNTALGFQSLYFNQSGNYNVALGYYAGIYIAPGGLNTVSSNSIYLGYDSRPLGSSQTNQIVIGYQGRGLGSNTTVVGNSSTIFGRWFGNLLLGTSTNSGYLLDVSGTTRLNGVTTIGTINAATTDTDKFLVSDSGEIKFRTGAELLSDIGGQAALTNPVTGTGVSGQVSYWSGTGTQTGSNNLFWDAANSRLGIGTNDPQSSIHLIDTGNANRGVLIDQISSDALAASAAWRKARGTVSSPSAVLSGDNLGFFGFRGYHSGGAYPSQSSGYIQVTAEQNFTSTALGARIEFGTITNGSSSNSVKMMLKNNGNLLLQNGGTFTDSGQRLQVQGTTLLNGSTTFGTIGAGTGMFWDNTNNRLGVGTNVPSYALEVLSSTTTNMAIVSTGSGSNGRAAFSLVRGNAGNTANTYGWQFLKDENDNFAFRRLVNGAATTAMQLFYSTGNLLLQNGGTFTDAGYRLDVNGTSRVQGDFTLSDTRNIILGTTTGTKIGTATTQKIGFYNATPVVQPSGNIATALSNLGLVASPTLYTSATATLTTGGWSLVSGLYEQSVSDANITSTSVVDFIPDNADYDTVVAASILPRTDSGSGTVKVYAKNLPTANIGVTLNIWK